MNNLKLMSDFTTEKIILLLIQFTEFRTNNQMTRGPREYNLPEPTNNNNNNNNGQLQ